MKKEVAALLLRVVDDGYVVAGPNSAFLSNIYTDLAKLILESRKIPL